MGLLDGNIVQSPYWKMAINTLGRYSLNLTAAAAASAAATPPGAAPSGSAAEEATSADGAASQELVRMQKRQVLHSVDGSTFTLCAARSCFRPVTSDEGGDDAETSGTPPSPTTMNQVETIVIVDDDDDDDGDEVSRLVTTKTKALWWSLMWTPSPSSSLHVVPVLISERCVI